MRQLTELRRAAAFNNHDAFQWIGNVYEFGRGGAPKDGVQAYAWYAAIPANAIARAVKGATEEVQGRVSCKGRAP